VSGTVRDAEGREVHAKVRVFGRDSSTLVKGVVGVVDSIPVQGFQFEPQETGPYAIGVEAEEGWAVHRGTTDEEGFGGVEVRLSSWGAVRADLAPPAGKPLSRVLRVEVFALAAPALGGAAAPQSRDGPGTVGRLPAGRYRVVVRSSPPSEGGEERVHEAEVEVEAGKTAEVLAPR